MNKHRFKRMVGVVLLMIAAATVGTGLVLLGRTIGYFGSGADPASALNATEAFKTEDASLSWLTDGGDLPRELEDAARSAISEAYLGAWETLRLSHDGRPVALSAYFTGPAHVALQAGAPLNKAALFDRSHRLRLDFYAADGQIAQFSDEATIARAYSTSGGATVLIENLETYTVVMLLEDGNWRVRHWVRTET